MFKGSDCTSKRNNVFNYRVGKIVAQNCFVFSMNLIIDRANIYCWSRYVGRSALTMSPSNRSTLTSPTVGLNSNSWRVDRQSARAGGNSSKRRPTLRASLSQNTATVCSCSAATLPGSQSPRDSELKRTVSLYRYHTLNSRKVALESRNGLKLFSNVTENIKHWYWKVLSPESKYFAVYSLSRKMNLYNNLILHQMCNSSTNFFHVCTPSFNSQDLLFNEGFLCYRINFC